VRNFPAVHSSPLRLIVAFSKSAALPRSDATVDGAATTTDTLTTPLQTPHPQQQQQHWTITPLLSRSHPSLEQHCHSDIVTRAPQRNNAAVDAVPSLVFL